MLITLYYGLWVFSLVWFSRSEGCLYRFTFSLFWCIVLCKFEFPTQCMYICKGFIFSHGNTPNYLPSDGVWLWMTHPIYSHYGFWDLLRDDCDVTICIKSSVQEAKVVLEERGKSYMIQGSFGNMLLSLTWVRVAGGSASLPRRWPGWRFTAGPKSCRVLKGSRQVGETAYIPS